MNKENQAWIIAIVSICGFLGGMIYCPIDGRAFLVAMSFLLLLFLASKMMVKVERDEVKK